MRRCASLRRTFVYAYMSDFSRAVFEQDEGHKRRQNRLPNDIWHSPFPLPPLAEQHRIVAKVDELMGLCDRLEAARAGREAVRDRLAAASLARLNAPDPETFQDDARFALGALPALTTRPDQIKPCAKPSSTSPCAASSCRKTRPTNRRRNC